MGRDRLGDVPGIKEEVPPIRNPRTYLVLSHLGFANGSTQPVESRGVTDGLGFPSVHHGCIPLGKDGAQYQGGQTEKGGWLKGTSQLPFSSLSPVSLCTPYMFFPCLRQPKSLESIFHLSSCTTKVFCMKPIKAYYPLSPLCPLALANQDCHHVS
ncbi:hypothetical protein VTI28DRAFT_3299 [Corynascus sepedonium]